MDENNIPAEEVATPEVATTEAVEVAPEAAVEAPVEEAATEQVA